MEHTASFDFLLRVYLAAFFTGVAIFYTVRILRKNWQSRSPSVFAGERFSATWWNHVTFRAFRASIWMVCVVRVFYPELDYYLGVISLLNIIPVVSLGCSLLTIGFVLAVVAHFDMGEAWRSGIDPKGPSYLVIEGMFAYSRNPMFLGVGLAQLGFFLAIPSAFTAICLTFGWLVLYRQVKSEETHLFSRFAEHYLEYQVRVPRWF